MHNGGQEQGEYQSPRSGDPAEPDVTPLLLRDDVVQRLRAATTRPLTIVQAPAGYGKTEAVRQFRAGSAQPTAWASLSSEHQSAFFWRRVTHAFDHAHPGLVDVGGTVASDVSDDLAVDALRESASHLPGTTTLVLDGFDRVLDRPTTRQVARFVELLPANLRIVLVTRHDLHLPTGRWRAQGRVAEIGADDLRFGPGDTADLLDRLGIGDLGADTVQALTDRAEGWPAGVHLLARSLRWRAPDQPDAAQQPLDDEAARALTDRILGAQTAEMQAFLLTTSVLGRFTADLCRTVTGQADAGRMLREVDEANLFVVPLDDDKTWFRYQGLFAELLRAELDRRHPVAARALRRTAAGWFAARRDPRGAVHQLSAAGDLGEAFSLVNADPYDAGWGHLIGTEWSTVFPAGWIEGDPSRMLQFAALLGRSGRLDEATEWIRRAATTLEERPEDDPGQALLLSAEALWSGITLHAERCEQLAARALGAAAPTGADVFHERVRVVVVAVRLVLDDLDGAEQMCATLDVPRSSQIMRSLMTPSFRARIALRRGHLRVAEDTARLALQTGQAMGVPRHPGLRDAQMALAGVAAERGEFDEAERLIGMAATMADDLGWPAIAAVYRAELAHVHAVRWTPSAGLTVLDDVRHSLEDQPVGTELFAALDGHEARLRIAAGDLGRARALLGGLLPGPQRDLVDLRLAVAGNDGPHAAHLLETLVPVTQRDRLVRDLCAARLAARSGSFEERDRHLLTAARAGAAEGFCCLFLQEAPHLVPALRELSRQHHDLHRMVAALEAVVRQRDVPRHTELSERETAVLRYLPSHLTHQEIASELGVSTNTVKSHVRSLYRKLGVQSRPDAVAAARHMALL